MAKNLITLTLLLCTVWAAKAQSTELFLKVNARGKYTVAVDSQTITSPTGRFRFFEVHPGRVSVVISRNNAVEYSGDLIVGNGRRTIVSYALNKGLQIKSSLAIYQNGAYALDDWDKSTNNVTFDSQPAGPVVGSIQPDYDYSSRVMDGEQFNKLMLMLRNEPFKDNKFKIFQSALTNNRITVAQLAQVLKGVSFDDEKLQYVFSAYHSVADRQQFYLLRTAFAFLDSQQKFDSFLASR